MLAKSISMRPKVVLIGVLCLCAIINLGCGGGGGGSSSGSTGAFSANLTAGKISYEGSGDKDILYASVTGVDIAGGWIEDQNGNTLASSQLRRNDLTGTYEAELYANSFTPGKYVLKYVQNTDTLEVVKPNIQWTNVQTFNPAPTLTWDAVSRQLVVRYSTLSGGNVSYYLRIYNSASMLIRESDKVEGPEVSEYIPQSDNYRVMLIGEVKNADEIVETVRYFFSERTF